MQTMTDNLAPLATLWREALTIWESGGWAMWAIAVIAILIFGLGIDILLKLREKRFLSVPEETWRMWIDHPEEREGPIGELLDTVHRGVDAEETAESFENLRLAELVPFERDAQVMKICVGTAPLVGLLGTVTGMLTTFGALASGTGGEQTMGMVAAGISEALVTTETGLVIALPGLFFQAILARRIELYRAFLAHLETVYTQVLHRRVTVAAQAEAQRIARRQIAARLRQALSAVPHRHEGAPSTTRHAAAKQRNVHDVAATF